MIKQHRTEASLVGALAHVLTDSDSVFLLVAPLDSDVQSAVRALRNLSGDLLSSQDVIDVPGFLQAGVHRFESARRQLARRLGALASLGEHLPRIVVTSVTGLTRVLPDVAWIRRHSLVVKTGDDRNPDDLLEILDRYGYTRTKSVEEVGEVAVRGSILDLWTPGETHPTRIEFFDESVEHIRIFRAADQRSFTNKTQITILPSREFVWPAVSEIDGAVDRLNGYLIRNGVSGTHRVEALESLRSRVTSPGVDDLCVHFSQTPFASLSVRLTELYSASGRHLRTLLIGEPAEFEKRLEEIEKIYTRAYDSAKNRGQVAIRFDAIFPKAEQTVRDMLRDNAEALVVPFQLPPQLWNVLRENRISGRIRALNQLVLRGEVTRILVLGRSNDSILELLGILGSHVESEDTLSQQTLLPRFSPEWLFGQQPGYAIGPRWAMALAETEGAFWIPESRTMVISEMVLRGAAHHDITEVYSEEETRAASREASLKLISAQFADFSEGDLVVHVEYGIGRFCGLMKVELQGVSADFLVVEFANSDKVYVPVSRMNLVQRYVGVANRSLDSLRGATWEKRRVKAREDAEKVARELMDHQARRATTPGNAFSQVGEEFVEFEAAFPYDETPDQLRVIREINSDMCKPKAMDRLVVGDVGFGKTEVAMRAAYRAVLDGKQVAWLVPTTVLAHQHFRSLLERFGSFGVNIAHLDRSSTRTTTQTLAKLLSGQVDIVVGTHRLLSKDVAFHDLGLLVIDEEHRFGVQQKERIKTLSYGVDVLTMTATPIPRTLQMALTGLRELSLLTTPPKARLATKTFVCPFDESIIQECLTTELVRGGQVFFVHNSVDELPGVKEFLKSLVPKARICIGHGKMNQKDLDNTIIDFLDQKYDILLCTTIIESGIDMPNVNTILVQNADHFGLAQLYQLRGRVGRRSTQGYAYLLTSPEIEANDEGQRRLEILREHQGLGSGFAIATHDLEMRGSGSLLGEEQSGRITEVGLETYTQMLDEAIRRLGGTKVRAVVEPDISLPIESYIPDDYVSDLRERLRTYRRFFGTQTEEALQDLIGECFDRFGPLPEPVKLLAEVARIRRWMVVLGGIHLKVGEKALELKLGEDLLRQDGDEHAEAVVKRILDLCNRMGSGIRLMPDGRLILPIRASQFANNVLVTLAELKRILSRMAGETMVSS